MPYLLSLLSSEATIAGSKHHLCCYSNDTAYIELLQALHAGEPLWRRAVFPDERVLFTALPDTYLEIATPLNESVPLRRVDCQRLSLHTGTKAAVAPQSVLTPVPVSASVV